MAAYVLTKMGVKCLMLEAGDGCRLCRLLISGIVTALAKGVANILRYLVAIKDSLCVVVYILRS
jgi:hypothetical protein